MNLHVNIAVDRNSLTASFIIRCQGRIKLDF